MLSCCTDSHTCSFMALLWPGWNPHKDCINWRSPSNGGARHSTRPYIILVSLPHTIRKPQGEKYVWRNVTTFLMAAHREWCVQTFTLMSLMHQERITVNAQADLSLFAAAGLLELVEIDSIVPLPRNTTGKSTCRYSNRLAFEIGTRNQFDSNCGNVLEQLGHCHLGYLHVY